MDRISGFGPEDGGSIPPGFVARIWKISFDSEDVGEIVFKRKGKVKRDKRCQEKLAKRKP